MPGVRVTGDTLLPEIRNAGDGESRGIRSPKQAAPRDVPLPLAGYPIQPEIHYTLTPSKPPVECVSARGTNARLHCGEIRQDRELPRSLHRPWVRRSVRSCAQRQSLIALSAPSSTGWNIARGRSHCAFSRRERQEFIHAWRQLGYRQRAIDSFEEMVSASDADSTMPASTGDKVSGEDCELHCRLAVR